jgi:hydroxyacylglutathione hydrolase
MGCGRLFEGDPPTMWSSLSKLMKLPDGTQVYCGHEYTEANGRFALTVEPNNPDLNTRMAEVRATRAQGRPTLPSNMGLEKKTNPFLRPHSRRSAECWAWNRQTTWKCSPKRAAAKTSFNVA